MTGAEFNKKLQAKLATLRSTNKPMEIAIRSVMALSIRRIFVNGQDINGRTFRYSSRPIYVNPKSSPVKIAPIGKNQRAKFQNGRRKKTRYFGGGYKEFRQKINRESGHMNFRLFNELQLDYANSRLSNIASSNVVIQNPTPTRIDQNHYQIRLRDNNAKKVAGLEDRLKSQIFTHSDTEKKELARLVEFELGKFLNA